MAQMKEGVVLSDASIFAILGMITGPERLAPITMTKFAVKEELGVFGKRNVMSSNVKCNIYVMER